MEQPSFSDVLSILSAENEKILRKVSIRENPNQLCAIIEKAHWKYLDEHFDKRGDLPNLDLRRFAGEILQRLPELREYSSCVNEIFDSYVLHQKGTPTSGVALLNDKMDKILLVCDCTQKKWWGFPKGKLEEGESFIAAAKREVMEETGFDVSQYIKEDSRFIERSVGNRIQRIYCVRGIPENMTFRPQMKNEISSVAWVFLNDVPSEREYNRLRRQNKRRSLPYLQVWKHEKNFPHQTFLPFVQELKNWVAEEKMSTGEWRMPTGHESSMSNVAKMPLSTSNPPPLFDWYSKPPRYFDGGPSCRLDGFTDYERDMVGSWRKRHSCRL